MSLISASSTYGMNSPASGSSGEDLDPRPGLP